MSRLLSLVQVVQQKEIKMIYEAYVDGSYKEYPNYGKFYSSAAILYPVAEPEKKVVLTKVGCDDIVSMRNVAGEIIAVMLVTEHCMNVLHLTQNDTVRIFYDYAGIENWTKKKSEPNYWRCKNTITEAYRNYINGIVRPTMKLEFSHVNGHSGVRYNEEADQFAKIAMEEYVRSLAKGKQQS